MEASVIINTALANGIDVELRKVKGGAYMVRFWPEADCVIFPTRYRAVRALERAILRKTMGLDPWEGE